MANNRLTKAAALLSVAAVALGGCSTVAGSSGQYAAPIGTAPVTANPTPYSSALVCMANYARANRVSAPRIAIGRIADYTGKAEADGSGRKITQGASLMAMSAFAKAGMPLVERFDTSVSEIELKYANNKLISDQPNPAPNQPADYRRILAGQVPGSDFYVAGGITEALILAQNAAEGVRYQPGWILGTTAAVKVFIDIFIGVWSFLLAYIWTNHINATRDKARAVEIWHRFPKFIIGFVLTFLIGLFFALGTSTATLQKVTPLIGEANNFRVIFFVLTFFSIGVLSNFRKLWAEGFRRLAAVYFVSLFGFVIWGGLLISWLFFSGVKPPLAS